jgi:hypothetical protein
MAGAWDDCFVHIIITATFRMAAASVAPKDFSPRDSKYGHGQLGFLKDSIVLRVLREDSEVCKARPRVASSGFVGAPESFHMRSR